MKYNIVKECIKNNKADFPLSFNNLIFSDFESKSKNLYKQVSKKYNDEDYSTYKFFKPISRLFEIRKNEIKLF